MNASKLTSAIIMILAMLFFIPSLLFAESEEKIEQTYPLERDGKVYLENVSGDITVKSWQKNEIRILARKTALEKDLLDEVTIDIKRTDGNIRIVTRYKTPRDLYQLTDVSVYFDLLIPDKAQLRVKSVDGMVQAWEIGGRVDIETANGRAEVIKAGQGVKCKTVSGDMYLDEITGKITLNSTSGKITADGIKGSIEATNVSGDISVTNYSLADEVEIETIKGNIEVQGELSPGGMYECSTISGRTEIVLPAASDFELWINTVSGGMHCDFEVGGPSRTVDFNWNQLQGAVGKGGASLKASSVSGDILIKKGE